MELDDHVKKGKDSSEQWFRDRARERNVSWPRLTPDQVKLDLMAQALLRFGAAARSREATWAPNCNDRAFLKSIRVDPA